MSSRASKVGPVKRPSSEREIWQRIQKRGKISFITRCTLTVGCLLSSLTLLVKLCLPRFHVSPLALAGAICFCICLGYLCGSALWQRGQTILSQRAPRYRL